MSPSPELVVYGKVIGPVECSQSTQWGRILFKPSSEGDAALVITIPSQNDAEAEELVGLIPRQCAPLSPWAGQYGSIRSY
jgi:hypothetical protein